MIFSMNTIHREILSILIFFPLFVSLVLLLIPRSAGENKVHKWVALTGAFIELIFSFHLIRFFIPDTYHFQFASATDWMGGNTGIRYVVGVDGLNLSLILLSTTFGFLALLTVFRSIRFRIKEFLILYFILLSALIGVFTSLDVVLFYVFWELSLIPLYFMIGIWGGKDRIYATLKFFIYGVLGSVFLLASFAYLYVMHHTFTGIYSTQLMDLYQTAAKLPQNAQNWLFLGMTIAFLVKVPVFPFYTWLTDTYEQSPAVYTILSGVVLKLATYGLVRFSLLFFPGAAKHFAPAISILAIIGILYGAVIAWQQSNMRRLMAFSSLSHLGFIVLGIFSFQLASLQGALFQMINHAVTAGLLFLLLNYLMNHFQSQDMNDFGGLANVQGWYAFYFVCAVLGAVALPGTGSFIGELLILMGAFQTNAVLGTIATLGVVFGAVYMLWMAYRVLFGPNKPGLTAPCLSLSESFQCTVLTIAIFGLGFASQGFFDHASATLVHIEESVQNETPYHAKLKVLQGQSLTSLVMPGEFKRPSIFSSFRGIKKG